MVSCGKSGMGDLETITREYAPLVILERKETVQSIDVIAKEASEIADALKDVRESIDVKVREAKEDLKAVLEQDIDPEVYASADYSATVSYGNTTQVAYTYKGLGHDGKEANSTSYNANVSAQQEHELAKTAQELNDSARHASRMGQIDFSATLDPDKTAAKEEMKMRSIGMWHMMYRLTNWQFL